MLLVLGASVAQGPKSGNIASKFIVAAIVCRMFITPLIGLCLILVGEWLQLYPDNDPVFRLVMVLQQVFPDPIFLVLSHFLGERGSLCMVNQVSEAVHPSIFQLLI